VSAGRPAHLASGTARCPLIPVAGLCLGLAAACSAGPGPAPHRPEHSPARSAAPASQPSASAPLALQVTPAAYQLPSGISREVVLASGGNLLIIGGLNQRSRARHPVT
jgi:hypothetical protein